MAQLFSKRSSFLFRVVIACVFIIPAGVLWVLGMVNRSPYWTQQNRIRMQPVLFSHKHHVSGLGLDCRYCHTSVETSSFAGIPSTDVCMTCHSQMWSDAPLLAPVQTSFRENRPLRWVRVNDLPDFVYFDHSIHVQKGVACITCHGPVPDMPMSWQGRSLQMGWCLSCHRNPEKFIGSQRAIRQVVSEGHEPNQDQERRALARSLVDSSVNPDKTIRDDFRDEGLMTNDIPPPEAEKKKEATVIPFDEKTHVKKFTDCSTCHR